MRRKDTCVNQRTARASSKLFKKRMGRSVEVARLRRSRLSGTGTTRYSESASELKGLNSFPTHPLSPHTRIATTFLIQKVATERVSRQQLETHEVLAESHGEEEETEEEEE
jgi:hypothetical protein